MAKIYREVGISVGMGEYPTNFTTAVIDVMTENDIVKLLVEFPPKYASYRKILDIGYTTSTGAYTVETYEMSYSDELEKYFFFIGRKFTYGERAYLQFRCLYEDGQESVDAGILRLKFRPALRINDFVSYENNDLETQSEILEKLVIQHANVNASTLHTGHVMVDGETIIVDELGIISATTSRAMVYQGEEYITSMYGEACLLQNKSLTDAEGNIHSLISYFNGPMTGSIKYGFVNYYYMTNKRTPGRRKKKIYPNNYVRITDEYPDSNWYEDTDNKIVRTNGYQYGQLLQFDLSSIPSDANITDAQLALQILNLEVDNSNYVVPQYGDIHLIGAITGTFSMTAGLGMSDERNFTMDDSTHVDGYIIDAVEPPIEVAKGTIVPGWVPETMTWETLPSYNETPLSTFYALNSGTTVSIDLTSEVQGIAAGDFSNNGWYLKLTSTTENTGLIAMPAISIQLSYVHPTGSGIINGCAKSILLEAVNGGETTANPDTLYVESRIPAEGIYYYSLFQMNLESIPATVTSATLELYISQSINMEGKEIGIYHVNPVCRESLIKFDLSSIPDANAILEAHLEISFLETGIGDSLIGLHHVNGFWDSDPAYWAQKPAYDAVPITTFYGREIDEIWSLDITTEVTEMVGDVITNNGWLLKYESDSTSSEFAKFAAELHIRYLNGTEWSQYTVTWNDIYDQINATAEFSFDVFGPGNRPSVDVLDLAERWFVAPDTNSGIYIITRDDAETNGYGFWLFGRQTEPALSAYNLMPYLMVEYETNANDTEEIWSIEPIASSLYVDMLLPYDLTSDWIAQLMFPDISIDSNGIVNICGITDMSNNCFSQLGPYIDRVEPYTGYVGIRIEGEEKKVEELKRVITIDGHMWYNDLMSTYSSIDPKNVTTEDGTTYTFFKTYNDIAVPEEILSYDGMYQLYLGWIPIVGESDRDRTIYVSCPHVFGYWQSEAIPLASPSVNDAIFFSCCLGDELLDFSLTQVRAGDTITLHTDTINHVFTIIDCFKFYIADIFAYEWKMLVEWVSGDDVFFSEGETVSFEVERSNQVVIEVWSKNEG